MFRGQRLLQGGVIACLALSAGLTSCDNGCEQKRESFLRLNFVSTSGRTLRSMNLICTSGDRGYELDNITKFDNLELDLDLNATSCLLRMECTYNDYGDSFTEVDTLIVNYDSNPKFLDLSCGCTVLYDLKDVQQLGDFFRHVLIEDTQVRPESGSNIIIEY